MKERDEDGVRLGVVGILLADAEKQRTIGLQALRGPRRSGHESFAATCGANVRD